MNPQIITVEPYQPATMSHSTDTTSHSTAPPIPPRNRLQKPQPDKNNSPSIRYSPTTNKYPSPQVYSPIIFQQTPTDVNVYSPIVKSSPVIKENNSEMQYVRDAGISTAYSVPFPQPELKDSTKAPARFLIYTPPPPPLYKPSDNEKEGTVNKAQRKWQSEVRTAKEFKDTSDNHYSWKGAKSVAVRGINKAMSATKSSGLEFLNRVGTDDAAPLREILLIHPPIPGMSEMDIRREFINTILRTKDKATRDAIIATSMLPVAAAVDILVTVVWPFGGLLEIDAVWAYSSIRGAKAARTVSKRLEASGGQLKLTFKQTREMDVMSHYMSWSCHSKSSDRFPFSNGTPPMDYEVVKAMGWEPSSNASSRYEDEAWEREELKEDVSEVFHKAAREYNKWCSSFEKNKKKMDSEDAKKTAEMSSAMHMQGAVTAEPYQPAQSSPPVYQSS